MSGLQSDASASRDGRLRRSATRPDVGRKPPGLARTHADVAGSPADLRSKRARIARRRTILRTIVHRRTLLYAPPISMPYGRRFAALDGRPPVHRRWHDPCLFDDHTLDASTRANAAGALASKRSLCHAHGSIALRQGYPRAREAHLPQGARRGHARASSRSPTPRRSRELSPNGAARFAVPNSSSGVSSRTPSR